jgi:hypothetical protein
MMPSDPVVTIRGEMVVTAIVAAYVAVVIMSVTVMWRRP